jgi:hypothetical protein
MKKLLVLLVFAVFLVGCGVDYDATDGTGEFNLAERLPDGSKVLKVLNKHYAYVEIDHRVYLVLDNGDRRQEADGSMTYIPDYYTKKSEE